MMPSLVSPPYWCSTTDRARSAARCGQLASHAWHVRPARSLAEAVGSPANRQIDLALAHISPAAAAATDLPGQLQRACGGGFLPVIVIHDEPASEAERCACLDSGADEIVLASIGPASCGPHAGALADKDLQDPWTKAAWPCARPCIASRNCQAACAPTMSGSPSKSSPTL